MKEKKTKTNEQIAVKISVVSGVGNIVLAAFKLFAGILGRSAAMVSDAIHSLSDVFSSMVVIAGVKIAAKDPDHDHQYGHERIECIAAIILSVVLCAVGLGIGYSGVRTVLYGNYDNIETPGLIALIAAVVSIVSKEAMFWYTRNGAKKINSSALMAEAWHHRSDVLSSVGSFAGILGARLGFQVLDPIASLIICVMILKVTVDIFMEAVGKLTDKSCDDETVEKMSDVVMKQEGVLAVDDIKTRIFGAKIYTDIEIAADGNLSLYDAHSIAERVHNEIEKNFPDVKHCMVHVNPYVDRHNKNQDISG